MRFIAAILLALAATAPAFAQHAHEKGPNGGPMEDVAGVDAELITSGNKVTINVFDEKAKPIATKGFTGSLLIAGSGGKETLTLVASGENSLQGEAKAPIAAGTAITLMLKTAEGKSGQAKFKK
jgi:hypothetical protein